MNDIVIKFVTMPMNIKEYRRPKQKNNKKAPQQFPPLKSFNLLI